MPVGSMVISRYGGFQNLDDDGMDPASLGVVSHDTALRVTVKLTLLWHKSAQVLSNYSVLES
jgi:hypothetical protein